MCLSSFLDENKCHVFNFSEAEVTFPVRMTRPVTPLLYISHNKSELLELRKHVFIKDAHEGKINFVEHYCYLHGWTCEKNSPYLDLRRNRPSEGVLEIINLYNIKKSQ